MTIDRETVIRLVREAGALVESWMTQPPKPRLFYMSPEQLERFAALVLEHERKDKVTQLCEIGDAFERCIPTHDGRVLAAMIREGVTALDSHIRHACGRKPMTDDELYRAIDGCANKYDASRAVEAAHGIANKESSDAE